MDIISTVIDLYFRVMESISVRNVSIAILVLIIGIEFVEFFAEGDESETPERRPRRKPDVKKLLGLSPNRKGVLVMADEKGVGEAQQGVKETGRPTHARRPRLGALGFASKEGTEVIGSRTYTIRTVLEGNHIYLEKVEA